MIRDLAIYGAGGFGREMALMVELINARHRDWNLIGFFDDGKNAGDIVDDLPILGGIDDMNRWPKPLALVMGLADSTIRRKAVRRINNALIDFPVMIHPTSLAGSSKNKFGKGTLITGGCILTVGIELGEFVIINGMSTVGHDVKIGDYTSVMPGCNISGGVSIGEGNLIGTGVQILQYLSIGDDCKLGAGGVITRSVESGKTVVGIPAKPRNELKHGG